jgi:hypothetical protein
MVTPVSIYSLTAYSLTKLRENLYRAVVRTTPTHTSPNPKAKHILGAQNAHEVLKMHMFSLVS